MKKALLSLFVVLACSTAYGQIFQLGARAGVGRSDIRIDEEVQVPGGGTFQMRPGEPGTSFHVGAYTRFKIIGLYVQPELLYTNYVAGLESRNVTSGDIAEGKLTNHRLDIPVLIGIKLGPIRLNAGPSFNAILSSTDDDSAADPEWSAASFGWQYGFGVDIGKFLIDLKAEGSFDQPLEGYGNGSNTVPLEGNMHQVLLSIVYRIL